MLEDTKNHDNVESVSESTVLTPPADNLITVRNLKTYFPIKDGILQRVVAHVKAVDGISFDLKLGETLGLVGESGCGKTTVGRTILRLVPKTEGSVFFKGIDVFGLSRSELRQMRPQMQIIFQDPFSSLSPRLPVGEIIGEAVREHKLVPPDEFDDYIDQVMIDCGLQPYHRNRYPHEFSGGQRQRICIARAIALKPDFIVADEPVSMLDVSIRGEVLNLMLRLAKEKGVSFVYITHDLATARHICDRILVMYLGETVEQCTADQLVYQPLHPYTRALISAVLPPKPQKGGISAVLEGEVPNAANPPSGCRLHPRCPIAKDICSKVSPELKDVGDNHLVACHFAEKK